MNWQKALILWLQDKVDVLEYHSQRVHSATRSFNLPSVLRLRRYINPHLNSQVKLTRQNLFLRDEFRCQYCYKTFPQKLLTVDHVHPASKGGKNVWTNVVAACGPCNNKKGDKTVEQAKLKLYKKPVKPRWLPDKELKLKRQRVPDGWEVYLPDSDD